MHQLKKLTVAVMAITMTGTGVVQANTATPASTAAPLTTQPAAATTQPAAANTPAAAPTTNPAPAQPQAAPSQGSSANQLPQRQKSDAPILVTKDTQHGDVVKDTNGREGVYKEDTDDMSDCAQIYEVATQVQEMQQELVRSEADIYSIEKNIKEKAGEKYASCMTGIRDIIDLSDMIPSFKVGSFSGFRGALENMAKKQVESLRDKALDEMCDMGTRMAEEAVSGIKDQLNIVKRYTDIINNPQKAALGYAQTHMQRQHDKMMGRIEQHSQNLQSRLKTQNERLSAKLNAYHEKNASIVEEMTYYSQQYDKYLQDEKTKTEQAQAQAQAQSQQASAAQNAQANRAQQAQAQSQQASAQPQTAQPAQPQAQGNKAPAPQTQTGSLAGALNQAHTPVPQNTVPSVPTGAVTGNSSVTTPPPPPPPAQGNQATVPNSSSAKPL